MSFPKSEQLTEEVDVNEISQDEDDPMDNVSVCSNDSLASLIGDDSDVENEIEKRKKCKRGVVYLAFIPPSMNPTIMRRLLSEYGTVERIYLQPAKKKGNKNKNKNVKQKQIKYVEGWVEFLKKRDAKKIAEALNNTKMGGKKKSKFHEYLWNLKYLPRFKWIHLCERLNYERAVRQQKFRAEVSQAKKIANHFAETVDKEERQKRYKGSKPAPVPDEVIAKKLKQKEVKDKTKTVEKREEFLKSLFA